MKTLYSILLLTISFTCTFGQKYESKTSATTLVLGTGGIKIEGYEGTSIVIEQKLPKEDKKENEAWSVGTTGQEVLNSKQVVDESLVGMISGSISKRDLDDRKKGLTILNASGLKDNTGFGLSVVDNGTTIEINAVTRNGRKNLLIKVPTSIKIKGNITGAFNNGTISISNMQGDIDLSTQYNRIELNGINGPIMAKSTYGSIEGALGQKLKEPISLVSAYGLIDVALPESSKLNVELNTPYGNSYTSDKFVIELTDKKINSNDYVQPKITGKINGGGPIVTLTANYGNIYLRTKE